MEIRGERARLLIDPISGGRISSFKIDEVELLVGPDGLPTLWGCYPMAPWAGRVRDGRFAWGQEWVHLPLRLPPHALHGTVLDQPWSVENDGSLSIDLGPEWPWRARLQSRFELSGNTMTWSMTAHGGDQAMPFILGWHPWFLRTLENGATATFKMKAKGMLERGEDGLPTGTVGVPTDGPYDDCFCDLEAPIHIRWSHGLVLELTSSCAYWTVYDQPDHAICIEPQSGPPDGFNIGGAEQLEVGGRLHHWMQWRWWHDGSVTS